METYARICNFHYKTVLKAQGLTLPDVCLVMDKQFFSPGQAYVALSRATSWNSVRITTLDLGEF